jgi:hypothetical protein
MFSFEAFEHGGTRYAARGHGARDRSVWGIVIRLEPGSPAHALLSGCEEPIESVVFLTSNGRRALVESAHVWIDEAEARAVLYADEVYSDDPPEPREDL